MDRAVAYITWVESLEGFACSDLSLSRREKAPAVGVPSPQGAYELVRGHHFNKIG